MNDDLLDILLVLVPSNDDDAQDVFLQTFACQPGPTLESLLSRLRQVQRENKAVIGLSGQYQY